jgi:hypothetical protein
MLFKNLNSSAIAFSKDYTLISPNSLAKATISGNNRLEAAVNQGSFIIGNTSLNTVRSNTLFISPIGYNTNLVNGVYTIPATYSINENKDVNLTSLTSQIPINYIKNNIILHNDVFRSTSAVSGTIKLKIYNLGTTGYKYSTPYTSSNAQKIAANTAGGEWGGFGYDDQYTMINTSSNKIYQTTIYYTTTIYNENGGIVTAENSLANSGSVATTSGKYSSIFVPALNTGQYALFKLYYDKNDYSSFIGDIICRGQRTYSYTTKPVLGQIVSSLVIPCTADNKPITSFMSSINVVDPKIFIPCNRNNGYPLNYNSSTLSSSSNGNYTSYYKLYGTEISPGYYYIRPQVTLKKLDGTIIGNFKIDLIKYTNWYVDYLLTADEFTFYNYSDTFRNNSTPYWKNAKIAYINYNDLIDMFYSYGPCEIVFTAEIYSNELSYPSLTSSTGTLVTQNFTSTFSIKLYKKVVDLLSPKRYGLDSSNFFAMGKVTGNTLQLPLRCTAYSETVEYINTEPYTVNLTSTNTLISNNAINISNHSFIDTDIVTCAYTGTSFGLLLNTNYYVTVVSANSIKLSLSYEKYLEKNYVDITSISATTASLIRNHTSGINRKNISTNVFVTLTANTETEQLPPSKDTITILPSQVLNPVQSYTAKVYDSRTNGKVVYSQQFPVITETLLPNPVVLTDLNSDIMRELFIYPDSSTVLLDSPNFTDVDSLPEYKTTNAKINNTNVNTFADFNTLTDVSNTGVITFATDQQLYTGHPVRFICNTLTPQIYAIDLYNSTINSSNHGFNTGDIFLYKVQSTEQTIKPLLNNTIYYVIKVSDSKYKLALTFYNAINDRPIYFIGLGTIDGNRIVEIGLNYITLAEKHNYVDGDTYTYVREQYINSSGNSNVNKLLNKSNNAKYTYIAADASNLNSFQIPNTQINFGTCLASTSWPKSINIFDTYYVIRITSKTYKLATTLENSYNNINIPVLPASFNTTGSFGTKLSELNNFYPGFIIDSAKSLFSNTGSVSLSWVYTSSNSISSAANIDGFIITLYATSTDTDYIFGTDGFNELKYFVPHNIEGTNVRSVLINNLSLVKKYYTIGIQAYRKTNKYLAILGDSLDAKEFQASPILKCDTRLSYLNSSSINDLDYSGITMPDGKIYSSLTVKFNDPLEKIPKYEISQGYADPKYQLYINGNNGTVFITDWLNAESLRADPYNINNSRKVYFAAGANQYKYLTKKQTIPYSYVTGQHVDSTYTYPPPQSGGGGKK